MPRSDSDQAILVDLFGSSRVITVEGVKVGTLAELRTFISNIEALQNGQQTAYTFVSSWTNSNKTVLIQDFQHSKVKADESRVSYVLTLVEGTVI